MLGMIFSQWLWMLVAVLCVQNKYYANPLGHTMNSSSSSSSTRFLPKRNNETQFCFCCLHFARVLWAMYSIGLPITKPVLICVSMECAVRTCLNGAITWNGPPTTAKNYKTHSYTWNVMYKRNKKPVWFLQHTQPAKNSGIEMGF